MAFFPQKKKQRSKKILCQPLAIKLSGMGFLSLFFLYLLFFHAGCQVNFLDAHNLGCCLQSLTSQLVPAVVPCPDVWEWGWIFDLWPGGGFRPSLGCGSFSLCQLCCTALGSIWDRLGPPFPVLFPWVSYCQPPPAPPSIFSNFCHQLLFSYLS